MELLKNPEQLEAMLIEHGECLSQLDKNNVKELIFKAKELNQYKNDFDSKSYSKSFVFIKITPSKVQPMHMYGSHVPSDTINEISVCFAKEQDGKWIPDEDNVILRVAMSERGLSDVIFNRNKHTGEPANLTELNSVSLPKYEPKHSPSDEYFKHFDDKHAKISALIKEALKDVEHYNTSSASLSKQEKLKLKAFAKNIYGYSIDNHSFDFKIIAEKLERNSHHIQTELASSVCSSLSSVLEHKAIAYAGAQLPTLSPLACYYELNGRTEKTESLLRLVEKSQDSACIAQANRLFNKDSQKMNHRAVSQAMVNVNNPSGSPGFFFGDSRGVQDYFTLSFSFSSCSNDEFGDVIYQDDTQILELNMTRYQIMSLLQSSLGGNWVKGTLNRFLGEQVSLKLKETPRNCQEACKIEIPKSSEELTKLAIELDELLDSTSVSKKNKESILTKVLEITHLFDSESKDRKECFDVTAQKVLNESAQITHEHINDVLVRFGESLENKSKCALTALLTMIKK